MNFLSFEYVLAIQKAGTLRGAAKALFLSPQALSEHLGKLEKELGVPLFLRTTPLTLTPAGERFIACARTCLQAKQELETDLASLREHREVHLSLGVPMGMAPPLLLPFLNHLRLLHPELAVSISEIPTKTGALQDIPGNIDAVIAEFTLEDSRFRFQKVFTSRRFVVAVIIPASMAFITFLIARSVSRCWDRRDSS